MMKSTFIAACITAGFFSISCNSNTTEKTSYDTAANVASENAAAATATAPTSVKQIDKAQWLLGSWKNTLGAGYSVEEWNKQNDSTFEGKSFMIAGLDTLSSETVSLQQRGVGLFYIATVKGENNDMAVPFKLTNAAGDRLVFENPSHDFPQKITYTKISADSLVAEISGNVNGKASVQQFPMRRMK